MPPSIRPYIETYLAQTMEKEQLLARFGEIYYSQVRRLYSELDRGGVATFITFQSREDLERGALYVTGVTRGYYMLYWGSILQRLLDTRRGIKLIEQALEIGQGQDIQLELHALNNMAGVYQETGQPQQALELHEQALPLMREVGDRAGEVTTLATMAVILYQYLNRSQEAITSMEQAIAVLVETGLPQVATGLTRAGLEQYLDTMRKGHSPDLANSSPSTTPSDEIQVIITTTLQQVKSSNRQQEADFYAAILDVLNGELPALPKDHTYAPALVQIQEGLTKGGQ